MSLKAVPIESKDQHFRAALVASGLLVDDLDEPGRQFFGFSDGELIVGYGGLEAHGPSALIRSVVVLPQFRGKGFGRAIAERLLIEARAAGASDAFLLTDTSEPFFTHLGFEVIIRSKAPEAILATRQASSICATTPLLKRSIS